MKDKIKLLKYLFFFSIFFLFLLYVLPGELIEFDKESVINTLKEYDYDLSNINIDIISSRKLIEHIKKQ